MNRKGMVMFTLSALGFLLAIFALFQLELVAKPGGYELTFGEAQLNLMSVYNEAEKSLMYLDESGRIAGLEAEYKMGLHGGVFAWDSCRKLEGKYIIWEGECKPSQENFLLFFSDSFGNRYQMNLSVLEFKDSRMIVKGSEKFKFSDDVKGFRYNYSVNPAFSLDVEHLDIYEDLFKLISETDRINCFKSSSDIDGCFLLSSLKPAFSKKVGNAVKFEFDSGRKIYLNGLETPIMINFALDLDIL